MIAEERRRLLAEYGAELFEFLPRGTVKSEEVSEVYVEG